MHVLVFDTETTGLPKTRLPATRGPNNWPHMVSIAWIIMDGDLKKKERYAIIKPRWTIPADSTSIHGITQKEAEEKGEDLGKVIAEFLADAPDAIVAHNMNFDLNVLVNAMLWDLGLPYPKLPRQYCSMTIMTDICKLPSQFGRYKPPKLSELYKFIFNIEPEKTSLHNALFDVQLLAEILSHSNILRQVIGLPITGAPVSNEVRATDPRILYL
jgi:DNA polymerase III epsilon subunit-like protein